MKIKRKHTHNTSGQNTNISWERDSWNLLITCYRGWSVTEGQLNMLNAPTGAKSSTKQHSWCFAGPSSSEKQPCRRTYIRVYCEHANSGGRGNNSEGEEAKPGDVKEHRTHTECSTACHVRLCAWKRERQTVFWQCPRQPALCVCVLMAAARSSEWQLERGTSPIFWLFYGRLMVITIIITFPFLERLDGNFRDLFDSFSVGRPAAAQR